MTDIALRRVSDGIVLSAVHHDRGAVRIAPEPHAGGRIGGAAYRSTVEVAGEVIEIDTPVSLIAGALHTLQARHTLEIAALRAKGFEWMGNVTDETTTSLNWISEQDALPKIGQTVLIATPRQADEFWDIRTMVLLARHEGVVARPVRAGSEWPTEYYWGDGRSRDANTLITGNGWWASMSDLPLPPRAEHGSHDGYTFVRQIGDVFIPQARSQR